MKTKPNKARKGVKKTTTSADRVAGKTPGIGLEVRLCEVSLQNRLAAFLVEIAALPMAASRRVLREAADEAYLDAGCGSRSDLVLACLWLAKEAAEQGNLDHAELAGFYAREAIDGGDHTPEDCAKWADEFGQASAAYEAARDALALAGETLSKTLDRINL